MAPASHLVLRAVPLFVGLALTHAAAAGGVARDGDHKASNSFTLLTMSAPVKAPTGGPSNGVGIGPAKPVVSNPYNVPLFQNAGSLRSGR